MKDKPFSPDWVSPTGDTIKSCLLEKGMSEQAFTLILSSCCFIHTEEVQKILGGEAKIDEDIAEALHIILGATKNFWMNRDRQYWEDRERLGISND